MNYLIRLKTLFAFRNIRNVCIYIFLTICLCIYIFVKENYWLIIILIFILGIYFIFNKTLFSYSIIILFFVLIHLIISQILYQNQESYVNSQFEVYSITQYNDYQKVYIKNEYSKYIFYETDVSYSAGDILFIKGTVEKGALAHVENGFNYNEYLRFQNIKGKIIIDEIRYVDRVFNINIIHEILNEYIMDKFSPNNASIIQALILGEKTNMDENLQNNIQYIGIGHLFVISGLHIEIIRNVLDRILTLFKLKNKVKHIIILCFLFLYYIATSFIVSILRVIIGFLLNKIFTNQFKQLSSIDKLSLNATIVLLINPFYLFSYSFLLSYIIVFGILLSSKKLKEGKSIKNFLYNNIYISFISTLISFPIVTKINCDINLLCVIYNLFFIPFVTYVLLPFSFITLIIPPLEIIYQYIVNFFIYITKICAKIDLFVITFSYLNFILIIIFYLLFLLVFMKKQIRYKKIVTGVFIVYLCFLYIKPNLNLTDEIIFLDLPSGDATLIHSKFNKTNILVDTGDLDAGDLVSVLKNKGIKTIDGIIISHGDSDHIGGLRTLVNEFKIKTIYLSYYDEVSLSEISKYRFRNTELFYVKKGDEFYIDDCYFKVLWPSKNQNDVNNNSIVLFAKIFGLTILFTGDIEAEAELGFIKENSVINVDILKLAHHGSKTSTTIEFLKKVKFKYAVAMNGYDNTFGFPHSIVVERLEKVGNIKLYNTLENGSIKFYRNFYDKRMRISTSFK